MEAIPNEDSVLVSHAKVPEVEEYMVPYVMITDKITITFEVSSQAKLEIKQNFRTF